MLNNISIVEYKTTMKLLGAKVSGENEIGKIVQYSDWRENMYYVNVPEYTIKGYAFTSDAIGSVVQAPDAQKKIPEKVYEEAMKELGIRAPGKGEHFMLKKICSVRALITVVLMLKGEYSLEHVNKVFNEVYRKLPKITGLNETVKLPIFRDNYPNFREMHDKIQEFVAMVKPFGNKANDFKDASDWTNLLYFSISTGDFGDEQNLIMGAKLIKTEYRSGKFGMKARCEISVNGRVIDCEYSFDSADSYQYTDEYIYVEERMSKDKKENLTSLKISTKTGLAYDNGTPGLCTELQMKKMVSYIDIFVRRIKSEILKYLVK